MKKSKKRTPLASLSRPVDMGAVPTDPIKAGMVFQQLSKKGWSIKEIASHTSHGEMTVRRYMSLLDAPKDIRQRAEAGTLSVRAALTIASLDPKTREKIKDAISGHVTENQVKAAVKKATAEHVDANTLKDVNGHTRLTGQRRDAALFAWRGHREIQKAISALAYSLASALVADPGGYYEGRGALAFAFFIRGDLDTFELIDPATVRNNADKARA